MTNQTIPTGADPKIFNDYQDYQGHESIGALFLHRVKELGEAPAHREKHFGIWESYSWNDFHDAVHAIAAQLLADGFARGDVVAILSENRREWAYIDQAVQCLGGITVGIYQTDAPSQCAYIIKDSKTKFLFVENDEQLDKFLKVEDECPTLTHTIIIDQKGLEDFSHPKVTFWGPYLAAGEALAAQNPTLLPDTVKTLDPDATALLVYTSGTTGPPKGAQLSTRNIMSSGKAAMELFGDQTGENQFSFLPLAHIWERTNALYLPLFQRSVVCFAESPETIFDNMREVSPAYITGVPRVWEKVYSTINLRMKDATRLGRRLYDWSVKQGEARAAYTMANKAVPPLIRARYALANSLVLSNLRRVMGMDQVKRANSGAAPISPDLLRWFWAVGVPVFEGWGQTECMAIGTLNKVGENRIGSIGRPAPHTDVRIEADSGEIQITGPHVFSGYLNLPEKTAETFTDDGWLRTGDVGSIDDEGYVKITGRIKDIIITAGGKNITPAELENDMKFSPYISDAVVIGDARKYLTALIMIDQDNVEKFAQDASIPFSNFASLCAAPEVVKLIEDEVEKVNKEYARVEQIKKVALIDQLLQAEDEELTPTMKLKRSFVEKKYADLIDGMY